MKLLLFFSRVGLAIAVAAGLAAPNQSWASVIYIEADDAGFTFDTARYIPLETQIIIGTLDENDGADVYRIGWEGGIFSAHTGGSDFDTMLSIFNDQGSSLAFNDDSMDGFSSLSLFLIPGTYFIGITYYPNNYMGDIYYYSNAGINGFYQISIDNGERVPDAEMELVQATEISEPSSLVLLAVGLAGILIIRTTRLYSYIGLAFSRSTRVFQST